MTKIEKKMPIPKRKFYADLIRLKKGDSFTFPDAEYNNLRSAVMYVKKRYSNRRFTNRIISATRRRIWRTR